MSTVTHLIEDLRGVGLSPKAAAVYMAVLESGIAFPSKIAETAKLNRSTTYKILTDLAVKGLVTEMERNRKLCYQAERPGRLMSFAKSQVRLAEERAERTKSASGHRRSVCPRAQSSKSEVLRGYGRRPGRL